MLAGATPVSRITLVSTVSAIYLLTGYFGVRLHLCCAFLNQPVLNVLNQETSSLF